MCNSPEPRGDVGRIQMQLPLEIWEVILKYLPFLDLMKASSVCYQWRQLARRISHERCLNLPTRLLLELIHEYNVTSSYVPTPTRTPTPTPSSSPVLTPLKENVVPGYQWGSCSDGLMMSENQRLLAPLLGMYQYQ
ncbi:uncharacterized protein LOC135211643 [Macrobrachium nipponense]|uniref:uncharacterized protein LOC135211643 n=1 Tax=Macrobrachium nipponense TaxID=159736 RepID=UPI0030C7DF78